MTKGAFAPTGAQLSAAIAEEIETVRAAKLPLFVRNSVGQLEILIMCW